MRIGYVGLGAMGRELAGRLAGSFDLTVFDLDPGAIARLVERGATAAASLGDVAANSDVIFLCLPKSENVEHVLFRESGLAQALRPGTVIVDQTSGQPSLTRAFAERLATHDVAIVDAPVSGGVPSARDGVVTVLASGGAEALGKARPALDAMTCNVFVCGSRIGDGQALKAMNNTVNSANRMATLEIAALGRLLGLDLAHIAELFNAGAASNFISEKMLPAMERGEASTDFALALMVKDLNQAADMASSQSVSMPASETARGMLAMALRLMGEDARLEALIPFMERLMAVSYVGSCPNRASEVGMSGETAARLLCDALAACNRVVIDENLALVRTMGLALDAIGPAIQSGSARSAAAGASLAGEQGASHDSMVEALARLSRIGARFGVPTLMTNQAKACLLAK